MIGIAFFGLADPHRLHLGRLRRRRRRRGLRLRGRLARPRRRDAAEARPRRRRDLGGVHVARRARSCCRASTSMETFRFWQIGGVGGATWDRIAHGAARSSPSARSSCLLSRARHELARARRRPRRRPRRARRPHPPARRRRERSCCAARRPRSPARSPSSAWSCPHSAGCSSAPTTAGSCRSRRSAGAGLLVAADVIGRVVARPGEIEVGIITAFIGAPFFIWLVRRQKVREL